MKTDMRRLGAVYIWFVAAFVVVNAIPYLLVFWAGSALTLDLVDLRDHNNSSIYPKNGTTLFLEELARDAGDLINAIGGTQTNEPDEYAAAISIRSHLPMDITVTDMRFALFDDGDRVGDIETRLPDDAFVIRSGSDRLVQTLVRMDARFDLLRVTSRGPAFSVRGGLRVRLGNWSIRIPIQKAINGSAR